MTKSRSDILDTSVEDTIKIPDDILNALQDDTYIPPQTHTNLAIIRYIKITDTVKLPDDILNALDDDTGKPTFAEEPAHDEDTARVSPIRD